jgi:hypothetical protein
VGLRARSHLSRLRRCSKFKNIKLHRRCPYRKSSQAGENTADELGLTIPQLYVFADEVIA